MNASDADQELLEKIKAGDDDALAALYDKYVSRLLGAAYSILQSRTDAEDLIHDAFVEAWQKAASYDQKRCSVYGWLLLRVRSRALDRLRSRRTAQKHAMLQKPLDALAQTSSDRSRQATDASLARKALGQLSTPQREIVEWSYFQGLTCSEISARFDIPLGTVKSRMASAVAKLRQQLTPQTEAL